METTNFTYQEDTANEVLNLLYRKVNEYGVVLAAAPGAGKTSILVHIINKFLEKHPNKNVVIFAHNQKILVEQMLSDFEFGPVEPNFTYGLFGSGRQVEIGLPSQKSKIPKKIDLIVVDEAHQYYGSQMLNNIILNRRPKFQILLTGSPHIFNEVNKKYSKMLYGMIYISGEQLYDKNVYSKMTVEFLSCASDRIEDKYSAAMASLSLDQNFNGEKILIACKNMAEAYSLSLHIRGTRKMAVSTSENDPKGQLIKDFKSGVYDTLIVVNRGILGFSDSNITALLDFKCVMDINSRSQLIARILRKHPKNTRKFYVCVDHRSKKQKNYDIIGKAISLMETDNFTRF